MATNKAFNNDEAIQKVKKAQAEKQKVSKPVVEEIAVTTEQNITNNVQVKKEEYKNVSKVKEPRGHLISGPLLKQSIKANGVMWIIITVAVCFMLTCVMIIGGSGNLSAIKSSIQNQTIKGEITAQIEKTAINYYEITDNGLNAYYQGYTTAEKAGVTDPATLVKYGISGVSTYAQAVAKQTGEDVTEIVGIVAGSLALDSTTQGIYKSVGEDIPIFNVAELEKESETDRALDIKDYAFQNSTIVLGWGLTQETTINKMLEALKQYKVTYETYKSFGFTDYKTVREIGREVIVTYRYNLAYQLSILDHTPTEEELLALKESIAEKYTKSFLTSLPTDIADAIKDVGKMDLYGILVGSIFYKIAGLLLPIIYMIMASNNLIAGQVDSGSMAYVLSTPTKRKTVLATQTLFLVGSIFLMFLCLTATSMVCWAIVDATTTLAVDTTISYAKLALINLGSFTVMFAMSGICFLTSSWCNRAKHAMALGGGLNIFFLVATILGLFGTSVIPSIIRMEALNNFNYVSIITLVDTVNLLNWTADAIAPLITFLWKLAILVAVGLICYIIGFAKFKRKDLPL